MCLLAVLWRVVEDAPLIVAANREEAYDRPGTPPQIVNDQVRFVAGLDQRAGGTWLGVNQHGLLVAVTNGPKSELPPEPRSRGLLTRELLQCKNAADAAKLAAKELETKRYAGCNFICASVDSVYVVHGGDWLRVLPLPPGRYVQTHGNVNNTTDRRIAQALGFLHERPMPTSAECIPTLMALCSQPGICLHGDKGGTVSSSIIVLPSHSALGDSPGANYSPGVNFWHAQGPPDRTAYQDYSQLMKELR